MSAPLVRSLAAAAALLVATGWFPAGAQEKAPLIPTGEYDGVWHGAKVKVSVQETHANTFDGIAEFTDGRYAGRKFGLHGRLDRDGSLVVTRYVAGDSQVARVGPPRLIDGRLVWQGETTGLGLPRGGPWTFELRVPQP